jgi:hypothetical protein
LDGTKVQVPSLDEMVTSNILLMRDVTKSTSYLACCGQIKANKNHRRGGVVDSASGQVYFRFLIKSCQTFSIDAPEHATLLYESSEWDMRGLSLFFIFSTSVLVTTQNR